jgi:hypothetical protein
MNNDIGRSFIATLTMFDHKLNFLELLHEKPALATVRLFSGGFYTGPPQTRDHSSLLGLRRHEQGEAVKPLKLHFRHTAGGYILSIKNAGEYYNKLMSESWLEVLGAVDPDKEQPTVFTLIDHNNKPVTLDNLPATHSPVSLRTKDKKYMGGLTIKGSPYVYLASTAERSKITFILSILERNVPYMAS